MLQDKDMPDYTAPLLGIRQWKVADNHRMFSLCVSDEWCPGEEIEARCYTYYMSGPNSPDKLLLKHEDPPRTSCGCGLWAYYLEEEKRLRPIHEDYPLVTISGIASATGRVILCEFSFKAERMRMEALIKGNSQCVAYEEVAQHHGVPLIEPEEVRMFCELHNGIVLGSQKLDEWGLEQPRKYR